MGKVIADLATSAASATFAVENATSSVDYVLSGTDGSANDHLKTDGSGNLAWVAPPAGGLTHASQWRLTTSFTGAADPITTNLAEVVAPVGFGVLGASMTESSGIFTFPVTGYWLIAYGSIRHNSGRISRMEGTIKTTTDNATYANAAMAYTFTVSAPTTYTSSFCQYIFDVTDTTTHKCAFQSGCASGSPTTAGAAVAWEATNMTFMRLADT